MGNYSPLKILALGVIASVITTLPMAESSFAKKSKSLPVPRFVSLKAQEANVRTGPGMQYPKQWVLVKKYIPLEIISEYQDWKKIRDIQGDEGWIHKAMLSGRRTAIVRKNSTQVFSKSNISSKKLASLENGVVVKVKKCDLEFCKISVSDIDGYISQKSVWGVYTNEIVD